MTNATAMPVQATATDTVNPTTFTDDEVIFYHNHVFHALEAMTEEGSQTKEMANRIAAIVGCAIHSPYYWMTVGVIAGMDEGVALVQALQDYDKKETATPTDESKDCR